MPSLSSPPLSPEGVAARLADLLVGGEGGIRDPSGSELVFSPTLDLRELPRTSPAPDVWAVDGGQGIVADARCLQVYLTRWARVRWRPGSPMVQEEGPLTAHLLGLGEERRSPFLEGSPVSPDSPIDVNLLRDWGEWSAVASCLPSVMPGGMVLIDGDLQPDWRIPSSWFSSLLSSAADASVTLAGVTKHTSLSWGGAPLLTVLERAASSALTERSCWWAPVARTRPDVQPGIQVVVARLDPDARFAFRVDLPGGADAEYELGRLSCLCDDAAFPGYPYPLSVADGLAACPGWLRADVRHQIDDVFDRAGVPLDVRERAFADRHRLMERY